MWESLILLIGTLQLTFEMKQDFFPRQFFEYETKYQKVTSNYDVSRLRLATIMRTIYEDAWKRIIDLNDMRFVVEESYEYEMGYVMHELYDRYKKLVEQYNRGANDIYNVHPTVTKFKPTDIPNDERFVFGYDKYERTELAQKLYFEIHHIANMIHEIPMKWQQQDHGGGGAPTNEHFYINQAEKARLAAEREAYLKKLAKERLEKLKKLAISKNQGYKPGQGGDSDWSDTEDFIRERMEGQGWQAWLKKRQENRSSYMPPGWLYEYGWDVPIPSEQQWQAMQN